jgi:hypothetical protein
VGYQTIRMEEAYSENANLENADSENANSENADSENAESSNTLNDKKRKDHKEASKDDCLKMKGQKKRKTSTHEEVAPKNEENLVQEVILT